VSWYRFWETGHLSQGPMVRIVASGGGQGARSCVLAKVLENQDISLGSPSLQEPNNSRLQQSLRWPE
jgi:hypothetical protein